MRQQRKSGGGFWIGLTIGVALGVAVVILFLPNPSDNAAGDQSEMDGFGQRGVLMRGGDRVGAIQCRENERQLDHQDMRPCADLCRQPWPLLVAPVQALVHLMPHGGGFLVACHPFDVAPGADGV